MNYILNFSSNKENKNEISSKNFLKYCNLARRIVLTKNNCNNVSEMSFDNFYQQYCKEIQNLEKMCTNESLDFF